MGAGAELLVSGADLCATLVGRDTWSHPRLGLWHIHHQQAHWWSPKIHAATDPEKKNTITDARQKQPFIGNHLNCS